MNETVDLLIKFINSCGFPIVACCFFGFMYYKMNETLASLTNAITVLTAKFDSHVDNVEGSH